MQLRPRRVDPELRCAAPRLGLPAARGRLAGVIAIVRDLHFNGYDDPHVAEA